LLWSVKDDVFEKITGKHQKEKNKADAKASEAASEQTKDSTSATSNDTAVVAKAEMK
jgi:hypothetical protein